MIISFYRSQISLQSEVKFDIWNEQDSEENSEFGEVNNSGELNECDVLPNFQQLPQTSTVSSLITAGSDYEL